jgi:hypothetical protein
MIVNVSVARVVRPRAVGGADAQAMRRAIVAAVASGIGHAASPQRLPPAAIRALSRAVAAQVTAECSRR